MEIREISQEEVMEATAQNLIAAGITKPDEYREVIDALQKLNGMELAIALVGSWEDRQKAEHESGRKTLCYVVRPSSLELN